MKIISWIAFILHCHQAGCEHAQAKDAKEAGSSPLCLLSRPRSPMPSCARCSDSLRCAMLSACATQRHAWQSTPLLITEPCKICSDMIASAQDQVDMTAEHSRYSLHVAHSAMSGRATTTPLTHDQEMFNLLPCTSLRLMTDMQQAAYIATCHSKQHSLHMTLPPVQSCPRAIQQLECRASQQSCNIVLSQFCVAASCSPQLAAF